MRDALATQLYVMLAGGVSTPLDLPPYVRLPGDVLDGFTGAFGSPDFVVERDGTRLLLRLDAATRFGLYASGPTTFVARSLPVPASARFEAVDGVHYDLMILELDGQSYPLPRLD